MKWLAYVIPTLTCLLFVAIPGRAANLDSGNTLAERCSQGLTNDYNGGFCVGFIAGTVVQAQNRFNPATGTKMGPSLICMPKDVTYEQMRKILMRYLDNHPEELNKSGVWLLLKSLQDAYPCGGGDPNR